MSQKKHKGDHGRRAERRAARATEPLNPAKAAHPRRVYLRNPLYITLTILVILAVLVLLVLLFRLGFWDRPLGSILSVLLGAFGCMCIYDVGLLMTACVTFGEGMVNAGKDREGQLMVFHAASVLRVEVRDKEGRPLEAPAKGRYKDVELCFVMASGRVNARRCVRLSEAQLERVKAALGAEQAQP